MRPAQIPLHATTTLMLIVDCVLDVLLPAVASGPRASRVILPTHEARSRMQRTARWCRPDRNRSGPRINGWPNPVSARVDHRKGVR
jgi:hypothetical protein